MKQTKRVHHINAVCLSMLMLITSASCSKKSSSTTWPPTHVYCVGITCQNGGTCALDVCSCPAGYNGTYCEYLSRNQFLGTFVGTVTYNGTGAGSAPDTITISADSDPIKVDVSQLKGRAFNVLPTFVCTMSIEQTFVSGSYHGGYFSTQDSISGTLTFFLADNLGNTGEFVGMKK